MYSSLSWSRRQIVGMVQQREESRKKKRQKKTKQQQQQQQDKKQQRAFPTLFSLCSPFRATLQYEGLEQPCITCLPVY